MKAQVDALEAYLSDMRFALGDIRDVKDCEVGGKSRWVSSDFPTPKSWGRIIFVVENEK